MLIIAGKLYVAREERQNWIDAHYDVVTRARSTPGCVDLYISADPVEDGRVNMFEQWESEEDLQAWRSPSMPAFFKNVIDSSQSNFRVARSFAMEL